MGNSDINVQTVIELVEKSDGIRYVGKVERVTGLIIEAIGPLSRIGDVCVIKTNNKNILAEVVGFRGKKVLLMPYDTIEGIYPEAPVISTGEPLKIPVTEALRGRVLDGIGRPIDGRGDIVSTNYYPIYNQPPAPLERKPITKAIVTGIKVIDTLITVGKGQRLAIFSGTGVGKTTLAGMIAHNTKADINVIALIGERGREVKDFIINVIGDAIERSVVVVATSDQPALLRLKGAFVATTIAEYFRDQGYDVMLIMDSITRFARAQREIGLALGEPPSTRGFPPSVFDMMPRLIERAGQTYKGSITAFYTVLVEGDDFAEPITDNVRGVTDGHITLSRDMANRGVYPAIDILSSISRLTPILTSKEYQEKVINKVKELIAIYKDMEDLISIGAYTKGSDPKVDLAIEKYPKLINFIRQGVTDHIEPYEAVKQLLEILEINDIPAEKAISFEF